MGHGWARRRLASSGCVSTVAVGLVHSHDWARGGDKAGETSLCLGVRPAWWKRRSLGIHMRQPASPECIIVTSASTK